MRLHDIGTSDTRLKAYTQRFVELYELYRIQHPTALHTEAVDYVREVMADSDSINFNWI
ncbi:hypothetical protein nACB1_017 [Acinetobacter phage nACB1]|nr:hypothetical protein nACB1_017 [Acinetobacter phage nACB1]